MKKEWYKTWWGILLIVLFFYILVPYLVWTKTDLNRNIKIAITALCIVLFVFGVVKSRIDKEKELEKEIKIEKKEPYKPPVVEEKESIIASAISLHMTEVIPQNWYRENLNDLYTEYGEVLTAGGIPGIADTPQDFANTARLKNYWAFGKGTAKWLPGTPGDLTRLHNHLAKYVGPGRAWGLAQNIHKMHFGTTNYKRDH